MAKTAKKRNPADLTGRNAKHLKKLIEKLEGRVKIVEATVKRVLALLEDHTK